MADEQGGTQAPATDGTATGGGTPGAGSEGTETLTVDAKELQSLRNTREQFLREKENTEAIRRENELLRQMAEQAQTRATTPPTGYDQRLAQSIQNLQERDPDVVIALQGIAATTAEQMAKQQAEVRFYRELGEIPADKRQEVERRARNSNLWPSLAFKDLKAELYDKETNELAEQRRRLQEAEDRQRRGVVRTDASPSPRPPGTSISMTEYDRVIDGASRGDKDARKRLDDVERGLIEVRPD